MQLFVSCSGDSPNPEASPATLQPSPTVTATAVPEPTTPPEPTPLNPQTILQNSLDLLKNNSLEMTVNYKEGIDKSDVFDQEFEIICEVDVEAVKSYCILRTILDERVPTEIVWQNASVWMRQGGPWRQADKDVEWESTFLPGVFQLNSLGQFEENYLGFIQTATLEEQELNGQTVYEVTAVLDAEQYYIHIYSSDEELGQGLMERITEEDSIESIATFIIDTKSGQLRQAEEVQYLDLNDTVFTATIQYSFSEITTPIDISDPPE
jgi:hypothetical protein